MNGSAYDICAHPDSVFEMAESTIYGNHFLVEGVSEALIVDLIGSRHSSC